MATSRGRVRSFIWKYFSTSAPDSTRAKCCECGVSISRGKTIATYSTKPLINHLKSAHRTSYSKFQEQNRERDENEQENLTAASISGGLQPWSMNLKSESIITRRITEMIAIDMQPFSIIEDEGFQRLINALAPQYVLPTRKYLTYDMTQLYCQVKAKLQHVIDFQNKYAFTTDIWTSKHTIQSYTGVTCHWISEDFERKIAVLYCAPFNGSHTSLNMSEAWKNMCDDWKITRSKVISVITNNMADMVKTFKDLDVNRTSCFVHTIQRVLETGLFSQKLVAAACAIARKVVCHFKHSSSAIDRFVDIQKELDLPAHELIQDLPTRFNSTFNMLERLVEQKQAIIVYASESGEVNLPTVQHWKLIDNIMILLHQFSQLTADASKSDNSISYVIPAIAAIKYFLKFDENSITDDVNVMKRELVEALCARFDCTLNDKNFVLATTLDPRYKLKYFSSVTINCIKAELSAPSQPSSFELSPEHTSTERSSKKAKLEGFWDCFDLAKSSPLEITELDYVEVKNFAEVDTLSGASANTSVTCKTIDPESKIHVEMEIYFGEPTIKHEDDPLTWWRQNSWRFPLLSEWARRYLAPPSSSVASERIFSTGGNLLPDNRSRLLPERAEQLIFLRMNMPLLNFNYDS